MAEQIVYSVSTSALWLDVKKIIENKEFVAGSKIYSIIIHTTDKNITESSHQIKLEDIAVTRDYMGNYGDIVDITVKVLFGDYLKDIYPYRDNLEVTIGAIKADLEGRHPLNEQSKTQERYKVIFLPESNPKISASGGGTANANMLGHIVIRLHLLDKSVEGLRVKTTQGIFGKSVLEKTNEARKKGIPIADFIKALVGNESDKILIDGQKALQSIVITPPDNQEPINQLILPTNFHVLAAPTFLQEKHIGVYTGGISSYIQNYDNKKTFFVFPPYNTKLFDKAKRKLIIYAIKDSVTAVTNKTYREQSGVLSIVTESDNYTPDDGERDYISTGAGFRKADARSFMKKPVKVTKDGPVGDRDRLMVEVITKDRDDGINYAQISEDRIGLNKFSNYSRVNEKRGKIMEIIWRNSDPSLIYPGMPCKYVMDTSAGRLDIKGVVVGVGYLSASVDASGTSKFNNRRYVITTTLRLFLEGISESNIETISGGASES